MNGEIQIFENELFGILRTVNIDGQMWFVASDVCRALSLTNPTKTLNKLDEDERSNFKLGRQGYANIINEPGLYSLILSSRKPEAKTFKRWVTHEVLPSLRTSGSYSLLRDEPLTPQRLLTPDDYISAARLIASCKSDRLPIVLNLLAKGGWDVVEAQQSLPGKISTADTAIKINEAKEQYGITLTDISRKTGIPQGTLKAYRNGARFPKQDRYEAIITAINLLIQENEGTEL